MKIDDSFIVPLCLPVFRASRLSSSLPGVLSSSLSVVLCSFLSVVLVLFHSVIRPFFLTSFLSGTPPKHSSDKNAIEDRRSFHSFLPFVPSSFPPFVPFLCLAAFRASCLSSSLPFVLSSSLSVVRCSFFSVFLVLFHSVIRPFFRTSFLSGAASESTVASLEAHVLRP